MDWLNYHHLFYFHTVVREGGIALAARRLRLSHPTVSAQVRTLERSLGERLLERRGREMVLTDAGRHVAAYASDIFSLGHELVDTMQKRPGLRAQRLAIGVADPMPKLIARRLLAVLDEPDPPVRVTIRQGSTPELVEELIAHRVDAVLSDAPPPAGRAVFDHLLGECGTAFFATAALARKLRTDFPRSLTGAPLLLPGESSALRRSLEAYFAVKRLSPRVVAEIDDSALLKVYAQDGAGVFAGPVALADEITRQYEVVVVGEVTSIRERYHLVTTERRIASPLVAQLLSRGHALFTSRARR